MKFHLTIVVFFVSFNSLLNSALIVQAEPREVDEDVKEHNEEDDDTNAAPVIDEASETDIENDDGLIQRNPNYEKPSMESILGKNETAVKKSIRRASRFLKRHKFKIMALVGVSLIAKYVSSEWLRHTINALFLQGVYDKDGKLVDVKLNKGRVTQLSMFATLLIFLIMNPTDNDNESLASPSSSMTTTLLFGPKYGFAAMLLRKLLFPNKNYNPAYIPPVQQHYTFELLNERYAKDAMAMAKASKNQHSAKTSTSLNANSSNSTIVVLDWTSLDSSVSNLDMLKDSVSFLLSLDNGRKFDVVVLLESPGGSASRYAMAAQQLCRLRPFHDITICVDTVAASGGYMIACTGHRIIAAPFALLGSIGVVGQSVNVHKVLENWGVRPLVFRGGRDKAPLGLIGEVTDENVAKVQAMVDDTHAAFKRHVVENRPRLADTIDEIASGDVWLGYDAVENGLIDSIGTSDDHLLRCMKAGARVLKLEKIVHKGLFGSPTTESSSVQTALSAIPRRIEAAFARTFLGYGTWKHVTSLSSKLDLPSNSGV